MPELARIGERVSRFGQVQEPLARPASPAPSTAEAKQEGMTAVERANAYMTSSGIDQATFLMAAELIARGDHKIEPGKTVLKNSGMTMVEISTAAAAFEAAATAAAVDADGREEEQGASPKTMASPMHESSRTESDIEMAPAEAAAKPDAQPESGPNATGYDCDDCKDAFVNAMLVAFAIVVLAFFVCCLSCQVTAVKQRGFGLSGLGRIRASGLGLAG